VYNQPSNLVDPSGARSKKPKPPPPPTPDPNAAYYICCQGGTFGVCDGPMAYQSQTNNPLFNLWQLKCRKVHEQQHQADFESGKFPEVPSDFCKGKKNGLPVGVPKDAKPKIECSGYTAQMECLNQAPGALMDREKNDVKDKIKQYCCGSK
jgi:hypothetical protein